MTDNTPAGRANGGTAAPAMPLFYTTPEALNPARHGRLAIEVRPDVSFARSAHAIPVVASEMPSAMRSYPIVFVGPTRAPVVITGLRPNENLFVGADGRWAEPHYIPAYVRRYPFILAEDAGKPGVLTLCIDRASDRVVERQAAPAEGGTITPLFEGSEATDFTKQMLAFSNQFQIDFNVTRAIIEKIDQHGLFAARQNKITLDSGENLTVSDFQVIDEPGFNALSDEAFLDLRKAGAMTLIYSHLASTNSWTSLLHQAKLRREAGATVSP